MSKTAIGATKLFALPSPVDKKSGTVEKLTSPLKLRPPEPLYTVGEGLDYTWYKYQIDAAVEDYNAGYAIMEMAERLNRNYREVVDLIMELAEYGRIKPRAQGMF